MAVLEIAQIGDPVLREQSKPVEVAEIASPRIQGLIDDLIETMRAAHGAGLASPQVRIPLRVCVIEVGDNPRYPYKPKIPLTVLINPVLTPLGDETFENYEGCLSVPNLRGIVARAVGVKVEAWDREGRPWQREIWGLSAGTFQHECDHLDGRLFLDRVASSQTLCTWEMFDRHHRAAFVERVQALEARYAARSQVGER